MGKRPPSAKKTSPRGSQEVGEERRGPVRKMGWARGPWAWPGFCEDHPSSAVRASARPLSCGHWPSTCTSLGPAVSRLETHVGIKGTEAVHSSVCIAKH